MLQSLRRGASLFAHNPAQLPRRARPRLETLEERAVPATFTVSNLNDAGGGSLRQAITDANGMAGADTIVFQAGLSGTITLTTGQLAVTDDVSIQGPGAAVLAVSGNNASRVFYINPGAAADVVSISGLTITGGNTTDNGGGILHQIGVLNVTDCVITGNTAAGGSGGGGILAVGDDSTLNLLRCQVTNNNATGNDGGGLCLYGDFTIDGCTISGNTCIDSGAGIYADLSRATPITGIIRNSTISGNTNLGSGSTGNGGGMYLRLSNSNVTIENSTISGNKAANAAGGVYLNLGDAASTVTIRSSTIAFNQAGTDGTGDGGGIFVSNTGSTTGLKIQNTIVSNNTSNGGVANDLFRANGTINVQSSLIQTVPAGTINGTDTGNIFGVDPLLAPLAFNGGRTQTHALRQGSAALNAGNAALAAGLTFDQRGTPFRRIAGMGLDIGAFELQSPLPPVVTIGAGIGGGSNVQVRDAAGNITANFFAFPGFNGAVNVASGDVNGDGISDTIVGTGNFADHVKVFSGKDGTLLYSFLAFGGFTGGVTVGAGDVDGDGLADIIVGAGPGAPGGHVKVFSGKDGSLLRSFFSFPGFIGGVSVAGGDVDGDGLADIIVGAGPGAPGGHVKVFNGMTLAELRSFFSFPGFIGGVSVGAGDTNGDGVADIIVGAGPGAPGGHVKVFSGTDLALLQSFFSFDGFVGGVTVGASDLNQDGLAEINVGTRLPASHVKVFDGLTLTLLQSFLPFANFAGGVDAG